MTALHLRNSGETLANPAEIQTFLADNGIFYEQWNLAMIPATLRDRCILSEEERSFVLDALKTQTGRLAATRGYVKWDIVWDVVALSDSTSGLEPLSRDFEQIHTHTRDEVRAIIAGEGVFAIRNRGDAGYFDVTLEPGDVISIPENHPHSLSLTDAGQIASVRLFADPAGSIVHPFIDPEET